jgi:predicted nucleic acid-binding protein
MNEVFVDTSGWASFFMNKDPYHAEAFMLITQWEQQNQRVVTTNYVLSELIVLFTRDHVQRSTALGYIESIRSANWVEIVHVDEVLDRKAWELLENRLDKQWSLVDAASFVVMREHGITEALATDKHFEQDGFVRLLK